MNAREEIIKAARENKWTVEDYGGDAILLHDGNLTIRVEFTTTDRVSYADMNWKRELGQPIPEPIRQTGSAEKKQTLLAWIADSSDLFQQVPLAGIEPATTRLGGGCSIH